MADSFAQNSRLNVTFTRNVSIIHMLLGVMSICIKIATLASLDYDSSDQPIGNYYSKIGHGIWAGFIYLVAGSFGIAATRRRTHSLVVTTVMLGAISFIASFIATVFSGISPPIGNHCFSPDDCDYEKKMSRLYWTLFAISIVSCINSIGLTTLASVGLCSKPLKNDQYITCTYRENDKLMLIKPQQTSFQNA